ncbi:retrovirus-related pol polyprotein from transposon TNT 1-94 [Tanacetum coccineum]
MIWVKDRQMKMVGGYMVGNQFSTVCGQNVGYQNGYNAVQNVGNQVVQDAVQNQNGQIGVQNIGNGNVVAARAEGNAPGNNGNQIRCYNCRGLGHLARNCTVRPRRRDAAYLQTQLLIAQKEEAGIQLQAEEFDLMAAAADLDEIEEVNANCILMANCRSRHRIFNMFTQEEQYTELLEPIPEPHQEQQNDSNVISDFSSVEQEGGTVDQHPATVEETRAYFESLYNNLALEVEKVNSFHPTRDVTVVNNERVIAPGIFRINPFKANRVANFVPNKHVKTSVRTKPIIVSQPHDDCVRQYVNGMKSRKKNQSANVSKSANQKKHKAQVWKPKNIGSKERFDSLSIVKPRFALGGLTTGRFL